MTTPRLKPPCAPSLRGACSQPAAVCVPSPVNPVEFELSKQDFLALKLAFCGRIEKKGAVLCAVSGYVASSYSSVSQVLCSTAGLCRQAVPAPEAERRQGRDCALVPGTSRGPPHGSSALQASDRAWPGIQETGGAENWAVSLQHQVSGREWLSTIEEGFYGLGFFLSCKRAALSVRACDVAQQNP